MAFAEKLKDWESTTDRYCGANSLFLLLNLLGRQATLATIRGEVSVTDRGANMAELARAATVRGLPLDVVELKPQELTQWTPLIACLGEPTSPQGGHFVVLLQRHASGGVKFVDGTTGQIVNLPAAEFDREFSGFALVAEAAAARHAPRFAPGTIVLAVIVAVEVMALVALWRWR